MKKYEGNMKEHVENMKKYEGNMTKYIGGSTERSEVRGVTLLTVSSIGAASSPCRLIAFTFSDLPIHTSTLPPHNPLLQSLKSHLLYIPKFNPLLLITSPTPPWLFTPPTIRLDLTNIPKSD